LLVEIIPINKSALSLINVEIASNKSEPAQKFRRPAAERKLSND